MGKHAPVGRPHCEDAAPVNGEILREPLYQVGDKVHVVYTRRPGALRAARLRQAARVVAGCDRVSHAGGVGGGEAMVDEPDVPCGEGRIVDAPDVTVTDREHREKAVRGGVAQRWKRRGGARVAPANGGVERRTERRAERRAKRVKERARGPTDESESEGE